MLLHLIAISPSSVRPSHDFRRNPLNPVRLRVWLWDSGRTQTLADIEIRIAPPDTPYPLL